MSEFDTNAVSSEVLLYRNNDRMIVQFVIVMHKSCVVIGCGGCFFFGVWVVFLGVVGLWGLFGVYCPLAFSNGD